MSPSNGNSTNEQFERGELMMKIQRIQEAIKEKEKKNNLLEWTMSGSEFSFISPSRERTLWNRSKKSFKVIREWAKQEVEQVKCVKKIILCWCANNYDNFLFYLNIFGRVKRFEVTGMGKFCGKMMRGKVKKDEKEQIEFEKFWKLKKIDNEVWLKAFLMNQKLTE